MGSESDRIFHLKWDDHEREKTRVFLRLNEIAWSRNVAVIYAWQRMKDFLTGVWDDLMFQSNGPPGRPNTCVFCGKDGLTSENACELGSFLADGDCFHDHFIDTFGGCFLESNHYRPTVIIIMAQTPGSIDNIVLELACGLGIQHWSSQRPSAPYEWKREAGESYGEDLVAQIAKEKRMRRNM